VDGGIDGGIAKSGSSVWDVSMVTANVPKEFPAEKAT